MTLHRAHLRVLMAVAVAAGLLLSPAAARGDAVSDWSKIAAEALLLPPSTPPSPPAQGGAGQGAAGVAHLAMVHGAIFDAVNSIDRRYEPYLVQIPARRWYSRDAAVAAAAHRVLVSGHVVRDDAVDQQTPLEARVDPKYAAALAAIPDGRAKWRGMAVGEAAAWFMIAERTGDGRFDPPTGGFDLRPPGPGVWEPTPPGRVNDPGAWLKDTTPFLLRHPKRFLSRGPDPLTSDDYARDFNEVKAVGELNSTVRTGEQTDAAKFWGGPTNAVLTWNGMIRTLAGLRPPSTVDRARFYALVYLTAADSLIVTWKDKQKWLFWRPIGAIRAADTDDNPLTEAQAGWTPLISNPPYPDHPSGLSAFGGSNVSTLRELFGTDEVTFVASNSLGAMRTYTSLSQVIDEIADARVWSGIHFRNADEQGAKIGREVARWRRAHGFLEPR
jgi:hypothetical protein